MSGLVLLLAFIELTLQLILSVGSLLRGIGSIGKLIGRTRRPSTSAAFANDKSGSSPEASQSQEVNIDRWRTIAGDVAAILSALGIAASLLSGGGPTVGGSGGIVAPASTTSAGVGGAVAPGAGAAR